MNRILRVMLFVLLAFVPLTSMLSADEAADEDWHTQMLRATVKISHEKSTATGWVVTQGERYLLVTAAHVFDPIPGDETTVVFRRLVEEGDYAKEPVKLTIRRAGQALWAKHPSADVAVIPVEPPKNADLPKIPIERIATDEQLRRHGVRPGERLTCLGYPHREEAGKSGFPLLRDGPIASFPLLPTAKNKTFYLSINTFEGDSGGPVYLARTAPQPGGQDVRLIMGLVSGQQILNEEAKMIYGTTVLRHRLGLAIVVHGSLIHETIGLLK